jgi:hypothetical protein
MIHSLMIHSLMIHIFLFSPPQPCGSTNNLLPHDIFLAHLFGGSNDPFSNDPLSNDPLSNDPFSNDPFSNDPLSNDPHFFVPATRPGVKKKRKGTTVQQWEGHYAAV